MESDIDLEKAKGAFEALNDQMGEIHAGRSIGKLAEEHPELLSTRHIQFVMRIAEGSIAIALRKFDDLWTYQIGSELLASDPPEEGVELSREINKRGFRDFANRMVAHYAAQKTDPKLSEEERKKILGQSGFSNSTEFFKWTSGALEKIEAVRERVAALLEN